MDKFQPINEREAMAFQLGYKKGFDDGVLETLTNEKARAFADGIKVGIEIQTHESDE